MSVERDWLLPTEVQELLGADWTRSRRMRIIEELRLAGVPVEEPNAGVYLVYKPAVLAYIERAKTSKVAPRWVRELLGDIEQH
jgi:hypothetical protein